MSTIVLGVDPGALRFGWSYVSLQDGYELLDSGIKGLTTTKAERQVEYRARLLSFWVEEFTKMLNTVPAPDKVVSEILPTISKRPGDMSQRVLGASVVSVCQVIAFQQGIPWVELAAVTVKKNLTGTKDATKVHVRNAVTSVFPQLLPRKKELTEVSDEADAIAIALCGLGYVKEKEK